jgi:hypothetical protein
MLQALGVLSRSSCWDTWYALYSFEGRYGLVGCSWMAMYFWDFEEVVALLKINRSFGSFLRELQVSEHKGYWSFS